MQALEDWNAKFGGNEEFTKSTKKAGFTFDYDKTYKVRIKSAKVTHSTRRDRQLSLGLSVLNGSDEEVAMTNEWLTLPKQPETDLQHDPEQVRKWTFRRRDDLGRILANVEPGKYALYADVTIEGGKRTYLNREGEVMSKADLDERQVEINKQVMEFADNLHQAVADNEEPDLSDFIGAEFYLVKVENKKSPKYPYTNYYGDPSPKLPMYEG